MHLDRTGARVGTCALALAGALACAAPATAKWTRISPSDASSPIAQVGLARTADGALHVVRANVVGPLDGAVVHRAISPGGAVGPPTVVSTGWQTLDSPALVTGADGATLEAFWGGQGDAAHQAVNHATSSDGGSTWTLAPFNLLTGEQVGIGTFGAARVGDALFQAWGSYLHPGTGPADARHVTASPADGCCGYDANVASDGAGALRVAWYSNQDGHDGLYTQAVDPATGAPVGAPARMPGTADVTSIIARTPFAGRIGAPGFVAAYHGHPPSEDRMLVWRVGAGHAVVLGRSPSGINALGLAAAPHGAIWAFWASTAGGRLHLVARRSNPAVTAWGAPVSVALPGGVHEAWKLDGEGSRGPLDLVAALGPSGHIASWYTRVLPGLTLTATPAKLHRGARTTVALRTLDAGTPVAGAKVKAAGASATTGATGRATVKLGPFNGSRRHLTVLATRPGFAPASIRLAIGR